MQNAPLFNMPLSLSCASQLFYYILCVVAYAIFKIFITLNSFHPFSFNFCIVVCSFSFATQILMWWSTSRLFLSFYLQVVHVWIVALPKPMQMRTKYMNNINTHITDNLLSVSQRCIDDALTTIIIIIINEHKIDDSFHGKTHCFNHFSLHMMNQNGLSCSICMYMFGIYVCCFFR